MSSIVKRSKALSVNPLKNSAPLGAALAFLGLNDSLPLMHGSQGCTAFAKVMFVRHFREPIPLQTTAMDQISTVMGADDSIVEALATICAKQKPAVVGLLTTGLSETQGSDISRAVREFRDAHPEYAQTAVVPVNTPDYAGCLESGFAAATEAIIDTLVPEASEAGTRPGQHSRQVNVLAGSMLTPGDIEALRELLDHFELRGVFLPDIADSLDGHLAATDFNPTTTGGTTRSAIEAMGQSAATLVIGPSMGRAARRLNEKTGVPNYHFGSLMGLDEMDQFIGTLSRLARRPVPASIERQRQQLQDAMLDSHFMLGQARIALATDPDLLLGFSRLMKNMGAEVVAAVTPARGPALEQTALERIKIGDLEDLERQARERSAELLIGNSHVAATAQRLGRPLLRAGFPQFDRLGGFERTWIGYRGTRQVLFDLANMLVEHSGHGIEPYRPVLSQKRHEEASHGGSAATACA